MAGASEPWDDQETYIYAGKNSKAKDWGWRWATKKKRLLVKSNRFEKTDMGPAIETGKGGWATVYLGNVLHLKTPKFYNFNTLNRAGFDSIKCNGVFYVFSMEQVYPDEVSGLCVICAEKTSQVAFISCGHLCVCEDCAERVTDVCPICRSVFTAKHRIYNV